MTHIDRVFRVYTTLDEFMYFAVGGEYSRFLGLCGGILLFCWPSLLLRGLVLPSLSGSSSGIIH